ncbi:dihydrofolate reductase family protein [Schlesneria paludicola]|uniref:dihydrofolate reductase family protein n=1 Tax=Schlesneria paludicola TaxID=360056 RepID=UPI00029A9AF2|nr:dihydrofolate reductase family protein [Schlesneria paludicola]
MSKVVLFIATSLDGYIASADGTVDWLFHDADYGYREFMSSVEAIIIGRTTWEQAKTFETVPFAGKNIYVFSRSNTEQGDDRVRFVQDDVVNVIDTIRAQITKNIWLVGGGDLIHQFIASRLIDEFRLFIHPIVLGHGIPLFHPQALRTDLTFEGSQSFPSGLVELKYRRSSSPV